MVGTPVPSPSGASVAMPTTALSSFRMTASSQQVSRSPPKRIPRLAPTMRCPKRRRACWTSRFAMFSIIFSLVLVLLLPAPDEPVLVRDLPLVELLLVLWRYSGHSGFELLGKELQLALFTPAFIVFLLFVCNLFRAWHDASRNKDVPLAHCLERVRLSLPLFFGCLIGLIHVLLGFSIKNIVVVLVAEFAQDLDVDLCGSLIWLCSFLVLQIIRDGHRFMGRKMKQASAVVMTEEPALDYDRIRPFEQPLKIDADGYPLLLGESQLEHLPR